MAIGAHPKYDVSGQEIGFLYIIQKYHLTSSVCMETGCHLYFVYENLYELCVVSLLYLTLLIYDYFASIGDILIFVMMILVQSFDYLSLYSNCIHRNLNKLESNFTFFLVMMARINYHKSHQIKTEIV